MNEPLILNIFNPNTTTTEINGQFLHSQLLTVNSSTIIQPIEHCIGTLEIQ